MLISDYSSAMFDFLLLDKPVLLCALDFEAYKDIRGFAFDLQSLPFPLAFDRKDLLEQISSFDEKQYAEQVRSFQDICPFYDDGRASENAAGWILEKISKAE